LIILTALALIAASLAMATSADAATQKLHFEFGPIHINPGQNNIEFSGGQVPKPAVDGWITAIKPNLRLPDGSVPAVDILHLHHALWLNASRSDATSSGLPERFFAMGEETACGTTSSWNAAGRPRTSSEYYEKAGPVSWDVSMYVTKPNWNVGLLPGDKLRVSTTYDSSQWSWDESMGIMLLWFSPNESGTSPFALMKSQLKGKLTHGHLKENNNHGGKPDATLADPSTLPNGPLTPQVDIEHYDYLPGNLKNGTQTPTVRAGQSITFRNDDTPVSGGDGTWHTVTSCGLPCNLSTGIAYPTANAPIEFDSGQLGDAGPPTAGTVTWNTPNNLPQGTYSFFCRVHPFMRGAFRVVP
jgi:hypothetical protein